MKNLLLLAAASLLTARLTLAQGPAPKPSGAALAVAQPVAKGDGKIMGTIEDGTARTPIEYASVALVHTATGKIVDGTITDDKGRFIIAGVSAAEYRLSISSLGFEAFKSSPFMVGNGKEAVQLGTIALHRSAKTLKEVSVIGERALIEDKLDRIVYNAEKDLDPGATAADLMKKVPGLSVDLDGNLQLRGSSNIRVLINGKPSAVMASSIADALQQLPANQIKSVEVITSPSAQYDAEGTAGIVNIITKKDSGIQGLTGSTFLSLGTINSNAGGSLNYRKGKLGLSSTLGYAVSNMRAKNTLVSDFGPGSNLDLLSQQSDARRQASSAMMQLGADYSLSKTSYLAAGFRMSVPDVTISTDQFTTRSFTKGVVTTDQRESSNGFSGTNYDINLDYTKTFKKPGRELSVLGLLSGNTRNNENFMDLYAGEGAGRRERNLNDAYNSETTLQTDYKHPIGKTQTIEVGAKSIWRYAESDFRFLVSGPADPLFVLVPGRNDVFTYHQDVLASYAMYGAKISKYNLRVGLRYEYTWIEGDFKSKGTSVEQTYGNLFPNVSISRNLKANQTFKFNYSKRIQRPQLSYLNPYENVSNPRNVTRGNPNLEAELTDSYELVFNTFFKSGASVTTSLFWLQTNNSIQWLSTPYAGADPDSVGRVTTSVDNAGRNSNYGLSLSGSTKFLNKGRISGNLNAFYATVTSRDQQLSNSGLMYNGSLNASYSFNRGLSVQMSGDYTSAQVTLQARTIAVVTSSFAVRKEILNKKGNLTLSVNNPFNQTILRQRTITTYGENNVPQLVLTNSWNFYMRQVRISFNYQFGKLDPKYKPRRIKNVTNEDAKEGDDTGVQ
jgi:ferric enterobactin receptor